MEDKELKQEFELERVILFSDAVFAIIITIMVLELRLPEDIKHIAPEKLHHVFFELMPKFAGYVISFFLVSAYWIRHLGIFKLLRSYDVPLVKRNLFFLFVISLFPFAVSAMSGGISLHAYWGFDTYIIILFSAFFAQTAVVQYIVANKNQLCFNPDKVEDTLKWKVHRLNFVLVPLGIAAVIIFTVIGIDPVAIPYIAVAYAILFRILTKKFYPKQKRDKLSAETSEPTEV